MPYIPDDDPKIPSEFAAEVRAFEEPYHEYWYRLGRFMHAYAVAEAELLLLLSHISGLSGVQGGVIFSETRCKYARELINKLLSATNQVERQSRLKYPFDQMAVISTVRNHLVHWGASAASDGTFTVSNVKRSPLKLMHYSVTLENFKDMREDLTIMDLMFILEREEANDPIVRAKLHQIPWRYKPTATN
jgi:hypothetical protein